MAPKRDDGDFDDRTDPSGELDFREGDPSDRIPTTAVGHKRAIRQPKSMMLQLDEPFEEVDAVVVDVFEETTKVFVPDFVPGNDLLDE